VLLLQAIFSAGECIKVGHRAYEGHWLCHPCYEKYRKQKAREEEKLKE
jgi:hypothetical protein